MSSLRNNTVALMAAQLSNYVIPLLLIPALLAELGTEGYGAVAFAIGVHQLCLILSDFGLSLSSPILLNTNSDSRDSNSQIVSSIILIKLLIGLSLAFVLISYTITQQPTTTLLWLNLYIALSIIFQSVNLQWYFQAYEDLTIIIAFTIVCRVAYVLLSIAFVDSIHNTWLVGAFLCASSAAVTIFGIALMIRRGQTLSKPTKESIATVISVSSGYFLSRISVASYSAGSIVILGISSSPTQVAIYSISEQIYKGLQAILSPITQALYPYMKRRRDFNLLKRATIGFALFSATAAILGYFTLPYLIELIFGSLAMEAIPSSNIFLLTFLFAAPSALLGYPLMGAYGKGHLANRSINLGACIFLLLSSSVVIFGVTSALVSAALVLATEGIILAIRMMYARQVMSTTRMD